MKHTNKLRHFLLAAGSALLAISSAHAQLNLTWDHDANGTTSDGGGTWLTANQWLDGVTPATWNNATPDNAIIGSGGTGGVITLGAVTANTVNLNNFSGTYTLSGGSLSQSGGITVGPSAGDVTISTTVSGTGGLIKQGAGTLSVTTAQTFTGGVTMNGGSLNLTSSGTTLLGSNTVTFASSGSVNTGGVVGTFVLPSAVINTGAVATINAVGGGSTTYTFTGGVSGSGDLNYSGGTTGPGNQKILNLNNSSGFTGTLNLGYTIDGTTASTLSLTALGDGGKLQYYGRNTTSTTPLALNYTGGGTIFNTRQLELTGGGTVNIDSSGAGALVFNTGLSLNTAVSGNRNIGLGGTNFLNNAFNGVIADGTGIAIGINKSGTGKWILGNTANSYTGVTNVSAGTLEVTKLADGGALNTSSIGTSSNAASNLLLGNGTTLRYTGTGHSTDRSFRIAGTSAGHGATLDASGTGAINFTNTASPEYGTADQTRTLNLRGTNMGANTLAANLANNGSGAVSVTKADAGTWILSGTNSYTGATTISGGTLTLNRHTGTISASSALTFTGTGTFNMDNVGAAGALTQSLGALTFSAGEGTVKTTRTAAFDQAITFASLAARPVGATGNFVNTGTNSATNGFKFTAAPTAGTLINGVFYNGSSYATYDAGGFVRGFTTGDTNYLAAPTNTTIGASISSSNVDLTTGNITAQTTISANTINMRNSSIAMTGTSQVLSTNGILSSGSASATLGGGTTPQLRAVSSGGELVVRVDGASDLLTVSSAIVANGTSRLTKSGDGTLSLTGANTYTGATAVNAGKLLLSGSGSLAAAGAISIATGATLEKATSQFQTLSGAITGGGSLVHSNAGLAISGSINDFGNLTITAGRVFLQGTVGQLGNATVNINGGTLTFQGTANTTYNNAINVANNGGIAARSAVNLGNVTLPGAGQVNLNNDDATTNLLTISNNQTLSGALTVRVGAGGSNAVGQVTLSGNISGSGSLTMTSLGNAANAVSGTGVLNLTGANSYTGGTTVNGGTINLGATGTLGATTGALSMNNTLVLNTGRDAILNLATGIDTTVGSLSGTIATPLSGINTATINTQAGRTFTANQTADATYAGVIAGAGNFTLGSGSTHTLTLSGANTYTGATLVSAGTLLVTGSLVSDVTVNDTATVGGGGVVGDLLLDGGSFFDMFSAVADSDALAATAISFANAGFGIDNLRYGGSGVDWASIPTGTYALINGTLVSTNLGNFGIGAAASIDGARTAYFEDVGGLQLVIIPEPSAALLGGLGVLLLLRRRR